MSAWKEKKRYGWLAVQLALKCLDLKHKDQDLVLTCESELEWPSAIFFLQAKNFQPSKPVKIQANFIKCLKIQSSLKLMSSCKKGKSK